MPSERNYKSDWKTAAPHLQLHPLTWPLPTPVAEALPPPRGQRLPEPAAHDERGATASALMILLASESLPRGGTVTVHSAALPEGVGLAVGAAGQGAVLKPDMAAGLEMAGGEDDLTARNVHAYFAQHLAQAEGGRIETSQETDGEIQFMALLV